MREVPGQLTDEQAEHFLERGFLTVRGAFDAASARRRLQDAWIRFGYDRDDPGSWAEKRIHLSSRSHVDARSFAPAAWRAAVDLAGGEERVQLPWQWGDGYIANLGVGHDRPWQPPSPAAGGWHKDGDFFRHFLDSPEQALLSLVLWTDMLPKGGGTFVAADSVPVVARFLARHPEGVLPGDFDYAALIGQCRDFVELTGEAGDVVLLHPYLLHATSQNVLGVARIITNPPLALREPMNFSRPRPGDYSLVEQAVLRGLGVERLDFAPAAPREDVVPERVRRQQARAVAEDARLAAARDIARPAASRAGPGQHGLRPS
jgi:Phytanoyl-CoA dioxygenase (PhyH)